MSKAIPGRPNRPLVVKCGYEGSFRRVNFPSAQTCRLESIRLRVSRRPPANSNLSSLYQSTCSLWSRWKNVSISLRHLLHWLIRMTMAKSSQSAPRLTYPMRFPTLYQETTRTRSYPPLGRDGLYPSPRKRSPSSSTSL